MNLRGLLSLIHDLAAYQQLLVDIEQGEVALVGEQALAADSTFALAYLRIAETRQYALSGRKQLSQMPDGDRRFNPVRVVVPVPLGLANRMIEHIVNPLVERLRHQQLLLWRGKTTV